MIPLRQKLNRALLSRSHRFHRVRVVTSTASVALLLAIPLFGLARLDLWQGAHRVLQAPATWQRTLGAMFLAGGACYFITFLVNLIGGRLYCGYGCPLAYLTRLREMQQSRGRRAAVGRLLYALGLAVAVVLWWVDPAVLVGGSWLARGITLAVVAALTLGLVGYGVWPGWSFCVKWCPIGLYYAIVSPTKSWGLHFDPGGNCVECNACDNVCPVELPPRTLGELTTRDGGLSIDGVPALNHCLSCGDCIEACEFILGKRNLAPVPLTFEWSPGPPRARTAAYPASAVATGDARSGTSGRRGAALVEHDHPAAAQDGDHSEAHHEQTGHPQSASSQPR